MQNNSLANNQLKSMLNSYDEQFISTNNWCKSQSNFIEEIIFTEIVMRNCREFLTLMISSRKSEIA